MKLVNIKELASFLNIKESTVYAWVHNGTIPFYKLNGLLRFNMEEIMEWVKNSKADSPKIPKSLKKSTRADIDSIVNKAVESARAKSYNSVKRENQPESGPQKGGF